MGDIPLLNDKGYDNILTHKVNYVTIGEEGPKTQEEKEAIKDYRSAMGLYNGYFNNHNITINKENINSFIYRTYFEAFDLKAFNINQESQFLDLYEVISIVESDFELIFYKSDGLYVVGLSLDILEKLINYLKKKRSWKSRYIYETLLDWKKDFEKQNREKKNVKFGITTNWSLYGETSQDVNNRFKEIKIKAHENICGFNITELKSSLERSVKRHEEMHKLQNIRHGSSRAGRMENRVKEKTSNLYPYRQLKLWETDEYHNFMQSRFKVALIMEVGSFLASIITKFSPNIETDERVLIYEALRSIDLFKYDSKMPFVSTLIEKLGFNIKKRYWNYIEDNKHDLAMLMLVTGRISLLEDYAACDLPWQVNEYTIGLVMKYLDQLEKIVSEPYDFVGDDFISNLLIEIDNKLEEYLNEMDLAYNSFMNLYEQKYQELKEMKYSIES